MWKCYQIWSMTAVNMKNAVLSSGRCDILEETAVFKFRETVAGDRGKSILQEVISQKTIILIYKTYIKLIFYKHL
jgi:hypothetical protein